MWYTFSWAATKRMHTGVALHLAYLLQWRMEGAHIRHTFVFSYEQRGPSTLCSCHRPFVRKMWFLFPLEWKLSLQMQVVTWPDFCTCFQEASRSTAGCINIKHADQLSWGLSVNYANTQPWSTSTVVLTSEVAKKDTFRMLHMMRCFDNASCSTSDF